MQPLIGGTPLLTQSSSMEKSELGEDTSHLGVITRTPRSRSSDTAEEADIDEAPDLDGKIRLFAPLEAIHCFKCISSPFMVLIMSCLHFPTSAQ